MKGAFEYLRHRIYKKSLDVRNNHRSNLFKKKVHMDFTEYYDWTKNFEMNLHIMWFMGLWPRSDKIEGIYEIYSKIMVSLFVVFHLLTQVINIYFVRDNLESVVGIIYIILIAFVATFKVYYVLKNMDILKEQIVTLKSDWFQPINNHQKLLIEPSINFWKNIYKVLLLMCVSCNTFWMIYPLLDSSLQEKRLPFLAWYPFDYKISPYYEITYIFQTLSTMYFTLIHINIDTIISGFNVYAGCQFDLLGDNIRHFADSCRNNSDVNTCLINCILHHKKILRYNKKRK